MTYKIITNIGREEILDKNIGKIMRTQEIKNLLKISNSTHLQDCVISKRLDKIDNGVYRIK